MPFFHLRSSGFWHLLPQPGQEAALEAEIDQLVYGLYGLTEEEIEVVEGR